MLTSLSVAAMGIGPARPDELSGALDAEGAAINRENAGPKSGGRLVVESILKHEGAADGEWVEVGNGGEEWR
jgi:hypothetical protein